MADTADAKSTEKHKEGNGKEGNNANDGNNGKEVEAGGQRIVGYGVQVFVGDKVAHGLLQRTEPEGERRRRRQVTYGRPEEARERENAGRL